MKFLKNLIYGSRRPDGDINKEVGHSVPIAVDENGKIITRIVGEFEPVNVADTLLTTIGESNEGLLVRSLCYGNDGSSWRKIRTGTDNGDISPTFQQEIVRVIGELYGYREASDTFERIRSGNNSSDVNSPVSDGILETKGNEYLYDEFQDWWVRKRSNTGFDLLASAARTATIQSGNIDNYNWRGVHVIIDVTAVSGTGSVTPVIQAIDFTSGKFYDLLVGPAITATGLTVIKLYPGIVASANASASDILPRRWRVEVRHADASSYTYSVGANVVV